MSAVGSNRTALALGALALMLLFVYYQVRRPEEPEEGKPLPCRRCHLPTSPRIRLQTSQMPTLCLKIKNVIKNVTLDKSFNHLNKVLRLTLGSPLPTSPQLTLVSPLPTSPDADAVPGA